MKFGTTALDSGVWDGHLERGAVNLAVNVHAPFSVLLGAFSFWLVPWVELRPRAWEHGLQPHARGQGGQHRLRRAIEEKLPTLLLCIWCLTRDELKGIGLQCL